MFWLQFIIIFNLKFGLPITEEKQRTPQLLKAFIEEKFEENRQFKSLASFFSFLEIVV